MPRKYVRKTDDSAPDPYDVLKAVKAIEIGKESVKSIARAHSIPRSSLSRYIKKINEVCSDISTASDQQLLDCIKSFTSRGKKTVFSPTEEESLMKYLLDTIQFPFDLTRNELCRMALEFAKKNKVVYPESWNENEMASRDWYEAFIRRTNWSIRLLKHINYRSYQPVEMATKNVLCRACLLHSDSEMSSLQSHKIEFSDSVEMCVEHLSLAEIYTQCVGIEVDSAQHMLCQECIQKLIECHKFRRMCQKSYKSLHQMDIECSAQKVEVNDAIKETIIDDIYLQESQTDRNVNAIEDVCFEEPVDETSEQSDVIEPSEGLQSQQKAMMEASDDSEMQINCEICPKFFFKKHRYEAHLRTHAGQKPYQCEHCEKTFAKYFTWKVHLATKHCTKPEEQPIFICGVNECGTSYPQKDHLRRHILKVHCGKRPEPKEVICDQCGKVFTSNAALIRHNYTHTKTSKHKCPVAECGRMFPTSYKLKEHTMRHDGVKNFVCSVCGLKKTTGHELRVHMRNHSKEVKYPCELCSLVFTQSANMKRHMKVVHCGLRTFQCTHCDRFFAKAETLKNHIMTHTGEKPFECRLCDRRFIQAVALKTHLKTHQKKNK